MSTKRLYVGRVCSPFNEYYPPFNVWNICVETTMADKQHIRARLKRKEIESIFLWVDDIPSDFYLLSFSEIEDEYQWIIEALDEIFTTRPTAALFVSEQNMYRRLYPFLKIQLPDVHVPHPDVHFSTSFLIDYGAYNSDELLNYSLHLN